MRNRSSPPAGRASWKLGSIGANRPVKDRSAVTSLDSMVCKVKCFADGPLSRSRLASLLATNRAPLYVLRERTESLLLCKVEPLNLKPFSDLYLFRFW